MQTRQWMLPPQAARPAQVPVPELRVRRSSNSHRNRRGRTRQHGRRGLRDRVDRQTHCRPETTEQAAVTATSVVGGRTRRGAYAHQGGRNGGGVQAEA
ncbi:hypothetical protein [Marisediminicola senii]|uniref:hypothetical protein n=1 Tax=Marisediminicola senii TaxID=2711233 RepID=UPI0013ECAD5A|nr:hypothetical protein [Marisediminicola senii]